MTYHDEHEALVRAVSRELCYRYELEDGFGETASRAAANGYMHKNFIRTARAVLALVAERLEKATPEMLLERQVLVGDPTGEITAKTWSDMLSVSPIKPKDTP